MSRKHFNDYSVGDGVLEPELWLLNNLYEKVETLKYSGSCLTNQNSTREEIKYRL
jgi:hypothetical protein